MAFKRRRFYKRRPAYRRKTQWYNKRYSVAQLATKAIKGVSYLKGLVNSERLKFDRSNNSIPVNWNGSIYTVCDIAQGDGDSNRTGNSVFARNFNIRFNLAFNSTTVDYQTVRVMLLIDKQQVSDTAPLPSQILENTGGVNSYMSHLNNEHVGRFTVLKSRVYTLHQDKPVISSVFNLNMRHHIRYNGPAGSDIQRGGIYVLFISDIDPNVSAPQAAFVSRLSYHDN